MVKFGIFDHLDDAGVPAGQQFEERLKLIELMEAQGFYAYHVAEHHSTPLGTAPFQAFSLLPPPSARAPSGSARWSMCCRFIIRCGSTRKSACSII